VADMARALSAMRLTGDRILRLGHSTSRVMSVELSWLIAPAKRALFRTALIARWDHCIEEIVARMIG
jgi:hypothetical protein